MFGYPGEEISDIYQTIDFVRREQPDIYLTTVAYPLRGTTLYDEVQDKIIYQKDWENHLQRELEIRDRFARPLYQFAIKKLASEFRRQQLQRQRREPLKQAYHSLRSLYCDLRIRQLSGLRT